MFNYVQNEMATWAALTGLVLLTLCVIQIDTETHPTAFNDEKVSKSSEVQHYAWWPERELSGPVTIRINTSKQEAIVYRNDTMIGWTIASTGRSGYETPRGIYHILAKRKMHRSISYGMTPMPYMQRLTDDGIAIHGGLVPNYPASHGCIRVPIEFAKQLYALTDTNTRVVIY